VWVRKETGGSSIRWHDGIEYGWPEDGAVVEVPDELGRDLLTIDGGEHTKAERPKPAPKPAAPASKPAGDSKTAG
jgi:hypothetical protein